MEQVDILSFDGGGSRGVMEVAILQDVMRLATILWQDPTSLKYLTESEDALKDPGTVTRLAKDLDNVTDPIHPTEVYNMIVGTSTGGLIAFGLVGGKTSEDGKRSPMTLHECVQLYREKTRQIFRKSIGHWLCSYLPLLGKLFTYPQKNVKEVLYEQFQGCRLSDFNCSKSVAGAVARRIDQKEELVLFDTRNDIYSGYKTEHVLLATSNAPVFFKTPVRIASNEFVDGGVGGNCPLVQAIPRGKEIFGAKVRSALSIAPPSPEETSIPKRLQISYWLNYFVHQSTDGQAVYSTAKRRHKSIKFRRLAPRGQRLKKFQLDEVDVEGMLMAMNHEKLNNPLFLADVVATATAVVDIYLAKNKPPSEKTVEMAAQLAHLMGKTYAAEREYEKVEDVYDTALSLWRKSTNKKAEVAIAEIHDDIGQTMIDQAKFRQATELYRESVNRWRVIYGKVNHPAIANALYKLGISYYERSLYHEAYTSYLSALHMQQRVYEGSTANAEIAYTLNHIGKCFRVQEKYQEAIKFFTESLDIRRKLYQGKDHLDLAKTLNSLGVCLACQKKYQDGQEYMQEAFEMRERLLQGDKNHRAIAASLKNLGWCLMLQKRYKDADEKIQRSLKMMRKYYANKDHSSTATVLTNLAKLRLYQGRYDSSIYYAQQSIAMNRNVFGDVDNLMISKALNITGRCFYEHGKLEDANKNLTDAVQMMKRIFHGSCPTLADALVDLGWCLFRQEKYSAAKDTFEEALKRVDMNGETKAILECLAKCSEKLGETGNVSNNFHKDVKVKCCS